MGLAISGNGHITPPSGRITLPQWTDNSAPSEVKVVNPKFIRTIIPFCQYEVKTESAGWIRVVAMSRNNAIQRMQESGYVVKT